MKYIVIEIPNKVSLQRVDELANSIRKDMADAGMPEESTLRFGALYTSQ